MAHTDLTTRKVLPLIVGGVRAAFGVSYLIAPTLNHQIVVGRRDAKLPTMRTTARMFGARELYVGAGVLVADRVGPTVLKRVLLAGAALDVSDGIAFSTTEGLALDKRRIGAIAAFGYAALAVYTASIIE